MGTDDLSEAERRLMDTIRQSPEITAAIERAADAGHTGGAAGPAGTETGTPRRVSGCSTLHNHSTRDSAAEQL